jgi:hypothetical protein
MSLDRIHLLPPADQEKKLNGPALLPPQGVLPNLDDPPNGNILTLAIIGLCLGLSTIVFLLRAYSQLFCIKKFHFEDCTCPKSLPPASITVDKQSDIVLAVSGYVLKTPVHPTHVIYLPGELTVSSIGIISGFLGLHLQHRPRSRLLRTSVECRCQGSIQYLLCK